MRLKLQPTTADCTILLVACSLLLFLILSPVQARRHHNHGDPDKADGRRREKLQRQQRRPLSWGKDQDLGRSVSGLEDDDQSTIGNSNGKAVYHDNKDGGFMAPFSMAGIVEEDTPVSNSKLGRKSSKGHKKKSKNKSKVNKHHQHHPVDQSEDTVAKDQWKRITNYHKSDDDGCTNLRCRRRQVCLIDVDTGDAECVHRRVLRMKKKIKKAANLAKKGKKHKADKWREASETDYLISEEDESEDVRIKEHIERVQNSPEYRQKEEMMLRPKPKTAYDYMDRSASKKSEGYVRKSNSALDIKPEKACTKQDMDEMGRRLLDWFKLLMEDAEKRKDQQNIHHKSKRNSKKKELREDDECICQAPVSWEFQQLDMDSSNLLSAGELRDIEDNGYEHCVRPFIDVCDHNHDLQLSQKEWCCCFADILPPCLSAQRRIPTEERNGRSQVLVGAFVPTCDEDGFFEREQCHGSMGQCWCVDRNGHEIHNTRRQGAAHCDKYTERYIQENI